MIIVSDTSPIVTLLKADCLWVLEKMFSKVIIPKGVYDELVSNDNFTEEAEKVKTSNFISVTDVKNLEFVKKLNEKLDKGESQAIALAKELNMNLLIDERKGRREAIKYNIQVFGTIGVLKYAYNNKWLSDIQINQCKDKMIKAKIRISEDLFDTIF